MSRQANITARIALVNPATNLPDGQYDARWSGYGVRLAGEDEPTWETVEGCRSFDGAPVVVTVVNGVATVEE
jgi:hypothetical protein